MAAVILAWTGGVEFFIVLLHQRLPPDWVLPNPVLKGVFDSLLLLLRKRRLLLVQHALFYAVFIGRVVDPHVAQIQRVLQNPVRIGAFRAVGHVRIDILRRQDKFAADIPFCGAGRIADLNRGLPAVRRLEGLLHKLLDIVLINPRRAEAHFDLRRIQIFRLRLFQRRDIDTVIRRTVFGESRRGVAAGNAQLLADVSGEVFVCRLPFSFHGVKENDAVQLVDQFLLTFPGKLRHIVHIHAGFFRDGQRQRLRSRVHGGHDLMRLDGALGENIRFSL